MRHDSDPRGDLGDPLDGMANRHRRSAHERRGSGVTARNVWKWKDERRPEVEAVLRASRTRQDAAAALKTTANALDTLCRRWGFVPSDLLGRGETPTLERPPPCDLDVADLVADRKRRFERKKAHEDARRLIPVTLKSPEPIGILHFGDPHIDDDGCDVALLEEHAKLVRETPGLYGANVGDTTNNWVGRLAKLYAQQSTSQTEAWVLAQWFVGEVRDWLYLVGGNHDLWSGAGDPMKWITGQLGAFYQDSEVRIALRFPGAKEIRVSCRHDFAGQSQWNPAHGPMKAAQLGVRDHLLVAGHKHISAYGILKDGDSGITMHNVLVASYKVYDRYARERGFRDQALGPAALTVIDPRLPPTHPDLIHVFWDPHEGAEFLLWKRRRRSA